MTPQPAAPGEDADDMRALRRGDDSALDRLMARWQTPLRAFLCRHTQDEFDSLDLAQETFVRVYRHRDRFRPETARFSTWLFSIALNLARDRARRLGRRPAAALENAPEPVDPAAHPRAQTEADERARAVRAAIAALPGDLRAALLLFEYEEKSQAEIAAIVNATPKAVETRLYRARQLLRKSLARWL
ncbi:MAG: sigma-70 family RNA polymerase sigma factor [Opitutaceae bacterium]|jgi:RNA polymerase sigma-70 factor (ECF subfamily)|nr:sigma-70 family RNA polymerase sigma factor [Opitutaceae bacterium]